MGGASRSVDGTTDFTFVQTPGQTPYSKTRLKVYAQSVLPFGELIFGQGAHLQNKSAAVCMRLLVGQGKLVCFARERFEDSQRTGLGRLKSSLT